MDKNVKNLLVSLAMFSAGTALVLADWYFNFGFVSKAVEFLSSLF